LAQVTSRPTDDNDDEFIERPDLFHRTLGFPESSPTLFDLLRLPVASVVCDQTPDNIPCIFFAETMYAGLEILFGVAWPFERRTTRQRSNR
jgi:hypothetical protein